MWGGGFESFFGGDGFCQGAPHGNVDNSKYYKTASEEDLAHSLKVSLEDLYNGKMVKLAVNRDVLCGACEGRGGKAGAEKSCGTCNGSGMRIQHRQIGPNMVQKVQSVCPDCRGQGKTINELDRCKACKGNKVSKERKVLQVHIEKGMCNGQRITFTGEGDQAPRTTAGDIVIVVQEREHATFQRKGGNLVMEQKITLVEALCGFETIVEHLDGRLLHVKTKPGEVIKPNQLKAVHGEGMPQHSNPFVKGELVILFKIEFPTSMSAYQVRALQSVFALPEPVRPRYSDSEECFLDDFDAKAAQREAQREAYDSDDDDRGQPRGVQCQQQ
ncbi:hypothetical protein SPRG_17375 [Saprolegnia parasitica CBS 223.65]|uniref:CR-type domain-containing protein n=1 Tax=Saprolegnia parasitica (strain CBS 223.65) TaxID=695850 RepID=A0A067BEV1_SAPPC|nr:hypothetical protein SPRG_17375 [Saprolegnia parasitica CBS 223.65]KDO16638.1 hypothetical protein SPRG_17375 [Saprolegnia parasitica CBS 223.65]|eukprot:XP_012212653.1 hypothetical protein SPRG_17375 [Saprolegnia parasitica CBS 223.65]